MSDYNFEYVLSCLQNAHDNATFFRVLIDIRKHVDSDCSQSRNNIEKLRVKGLRRIVSSLETPKKSVVNISLSILGNCCLDSHCARDAVSQFGVLSQLKQVLKRFPKEDSINGRVFRIVGNICQHKEQWATTIIDRKPHIIIHTVKFLKQSVESDGLKASEATIIMGLRSLREILNRDTLKAVVKTYEVPKTVGLLLIKFGDMWLEKKASENVLTNIVKLLQEYSRYRYYPCISEMRNTEKGDSIVYLGKILLLAPKEIIKIVMNFLRISQLKSDLPVPDIFNNLIEVLRDDSVIHEFNSTCIECIKCVCHLLEHPGNRTNESCGDSIPLLINVLNRLDLQSSNKIECCALIVSTLNKCKYNDDLISDQFKYDIVNVLVEKLKLVVDGAEPLGHQNDRKQGGNVKYRHSKRSRLSFDDYEREVRIFDYTSSEDENDAMYVNIRYDYSPTSSNDSEFAMSWTSGLSPESSPRSFHYGISESDSDDYSPVCSEVDPTDFPLSVLGDEEETLNPEAEDNFDDAPIESNELPGFDTACSTTKQGIVKLVVEIIDLLRTYVKYRPPVAQLGTPDLLLRLIMCSSFFEWPSSSAILDIMEVIYKILESHGYLLPLMQTDFIPAVYDLSKRQHDSRCSKCQQFHYMGSSIIKKMSKVAESEVGKGDIAHKLLRGSNTTKEQLALTIPYVIRNKSILTKLMLKCGGFEILMKLLQEQPQLLEKSIKSLCVLAKKFISQNKKGDPKRGPANLAYCNNRPIPMVKFQLDDGSCLSANRELLSKQSDYFARLLNGSFKESTQDVILLPNVEHASLQFLLCLMTSDKSADVNVELDTFLDVISLCDRFLMDDYRGFLADCVETYRMNAETIPTIYNWSLQSQTNLLRSECVNFALGANIVHSDRTQMFKSLFNLGCTQELVEDIKKLLVKHMT